MTDYDMLGSWMHEPLPGKRKTVFKYRSKTRKKKLVKNLRTLNECSSMTTLHEITYAPETVCLLTHKWRLVYDLVA